MGGELLDKGNNVIQRQWSQSIDQIETKRWGEEECENKSWGRTDKQSAHMEPAATLF